MNIYNKTIQDNNIFDGEKYVAKILKEIIRHIMLFEKNDILIFYCYGTIMDYLFEISQIDE